MTPDERFDEAQGLLGFGQKGKLGISRAGRRQEAGGKPFGVTEPTLPNLGVKRRQRVSIPWGGARIK